MWHLLPGLQIRGGSTQLIESGAAMIKLTINGKEVTSEPGRTVLEVARATGIEIPTLCSHESLPPYASCRFCIVEVAQRGRTRMRASCVLPVAEGMEIK